MGRDVPILTEKMCIGMIRTYPMHEKVSRQEHEGLGVSTRQLSRVCSAPRSCPRFWHVSGQRLWASFRAVAFIACMLSLLLHLQRKYLGYFCRGDVTVWLHDHLHGFGEVRAAGTERGELRWATAPPPAWVGVEPDVHRTGGRKSHRGCAPCSICGIWETAGHSGWALGKGEVQLSGEVSVEIQKMSWDLVWSKWWIYLHFGWCLRVWHCLRWGGDPTLMSNFSNPGASTAWCFSKRRREGKHCILVLNSTYCSKFYVCWWQDRFF